MIFVASFTVHFLPTYHTLVSQRRWFQSPASRGNINGSVHAVTRTGTWEIRSCAHSWHPHLFSSNSIYIASPRDISASSCCLPVLRLQTCLCGHAWLLHEFENLGSLCLCICPLSKHNMSDIPPNISEFFLSIYPCTYMPSLF